jgi:hypothetical protein
MLASDVGCVALSSSISVTVPMQDCSTPAPRHKELFKCLIMRWRGCRAAAAAAALIKAGINTACLLSSKNASTTVTSALCPRKRRHQLTSRHGECPTHHPIILLPQLLLLSMTFSPPSCMLTSRAGGVSNHHPVILLPQLLLLFIAFNTFNTFSTSTSDAHLQAWMMS